MKYTKCKVFAIDNTFPTELASSINEWLNTMYHSGYILDRTEMNDSYLIVFVSKEKE